MQAIILAAGKGTRMHPLTLSRPKQLILVHQKPLIEHIISSLPREINEVIVVIGYKGSMIQEHCSDFFCGKKMKYVWQHEALGTAHALEQAKHLLKDSFLLMYGDDLVDTQSLSKAINHNSCVLAYRHEDPCAFGVLELSEDGLLKNIIEKPEYPATNLVSASGIVLHKNIFNYYNNWPKQGERYITHALNQYAKEHPVSVEILSFWQPINNVEQLAQAEQIIKNSTHTSYNCTSI